MPPHPLTNFQIQKYYENKPRFNGVYSRYNLPNKIKDGVYITNLDEYADIGTHWIVLYANGNTKTNFDSFGVEYIPKKIKKFIGNKNIIINVYKIQTYNSVMCGYFCIGFIDSMLQGKSLTGFTNFFPPDNVKDNDKMILKYIKKGQDT